MREESIDCKAELSILLIFVQHLSTNDTFFFQLEAGITAW